MAGHATGTHGAVQGAAVTKSDATVLNPTRALWVGGAGNVAVIFTKGSAAVTLTGVPAGTLLPVQVTKVMSTNTTATDIVALY
jgi:hypothetical protein